MSGIFGLFEKQQKKLEGKKTFIIAIVICVLGILEAFEYWSAPEWIWPILGAMGLGFLRSGVNSVKKIAEKIPKK